MQKGREEEEEGNGIPAGAERKGGGALNWNSLPSSSNVRFPVPFLSASGLPWPASVPRRGVREEGRKGGGGREEEKRRKGGGREEEGRRMRGRGEGGGEGEEEGGRCYHNRTSIEGRLPPALEQCGTSAAHCTPTCTPPPPPSSPPSSPPLLPPPLTSLD